MPHRTTPSEEFEPDHGLSVKQAVQSLSASSGVPNESSSFSLSLTSPSLKLENEIAMLSGPGGYNFTSAAQALAYRPAVPLFPDLSSYTSVTIVDYGCAGVANSIAPLSQLLSTLPDGAEATIVLNDRTYNDWNEVSKIIKKEWMELTRDEKLKVLIQMSPVSFYNQVAKSRGVDVGLSFTAFNYLEHALPTPMHPSKDMNMDAEDLTALQTLQAKRKAAQAHLDLIKLLRLRAVEIIKGGTLITALASCRDQKPEAAGRWTTQPISAAFQASLTDAIKKDFLTEKQVRAFNFPMHEHHISDIRRAASEVEDSWSLEDLFQERIVHPAYLKLKSANNSPEEHEEYAAAVTGWVFGVLSWYIIKGMRSDAPESGVMREDLSSMSVREVETLGRLREGMKESLEQMLREGWDGETGIEYVYVKLLRK